MIKQITSADNPLIKKVAQLASPKGRTEYNQFIAEGLRTCKALLESPLILDTLFVTDDTLEQARALVPEDRLMLVSSHIMDKIASTKTPSGFLAVFEIPRAQIPATIKPGLVLYDVSDPGNMGTLIRSAIAFDCPQIILINGVDPYNPKVVQASAGTIGQAALIFMTWKQLLDHKNRPQIQALVPTGGQPLDRTSKDALLLVGGEAHGIPAEQLKQCDRRTTLVMPGPAESLNAAIAGSIALYLSVNS